jgi:competence ComEA-like helix-hairpin-helix protein
MTPALRRLAHLTALAAIAAWALALGRWLRAPDAGASLFGLLLVAAALMTALSRLYRPGGVTAVRWPGATEDREADDPGDARVDLNAAGDEELQRLPGVGPVVAGRILAERAAGGPFASVEDLTRVPGLGPARVRALVEQARAR